MALVCLEGVIIRFLAPLFLLFIGVLVVVESILDGQDVLVDRNSVSKELRINFHVLFRVDRFGRDAPDLFIEAI